MNCLEARRGFVDFWRRSLDSRLRAAFLAHLAGCARCDGSFRRFALTAPVLQAECSGWDGGRRTELPWETGKSMPSAHPAATLSWWATVTAFAVAAAAAATIYFLMPPRVTLEDAIAEGNQVLEPTSYAAIQGPMGSQDLLGSDDPTGSDKRSATPVGWMLDGD